MDASMMKAGGGLGKGQVRAKVEQSLKSMKRDTVDLLYLHAPDPDTREPPSLSLMSVPLCPTRRRWASIAWCESLQAQSCDSHQVLCLGCVHRRNMDATQAQDR
jgi:hypothetical protein